MQVATALDQSRTKTTTPFCVLVLNNLKLNDLNVNE